MHVHSHAFNNSLRLSPEPGTPSGGDLPDLGGLTQDFMADPDMAAAPTGAATPPAPGTPAPAGTPSQSPEDLEFAPDLGLFDPDPASPTPPAPATPSGAPSATGGQAAPTGSSGNGEPKGQGATPPPLPPSRNFDGIPPEHHRALRQMGNEAWSIIEPVIKQHFANGGQSQAAATAYDHPEAYRLDPGYAELEQSVVHLNQEAEHWRQQKINAIQGEPVRMLYMDDKGVVRVGPPQDPDAKTIVTLDAKIAESQQLLREAAGELTNYRNNFVGQYKSFNQNLNAFYETSLKPFEAKLGDRLNRVLNNSFPKALHNSPIHRAAAVSVLVIDALQKRLRALETRDAGAPPPPQPVGGAGGGVASRNANDAFTKEDDEFFGQFVR